MHPKLQCSVAEKCGGCGLINDTTFEQREKKLATVSRALAPVLACHPGETFLGFHPQAAPAGYRNRIRLRVTNAGQLAYFNESKAAKCAVLHPSLQRTLDELRVVAKRLAPQLQAISHLEIRCPDLQGHASVFLTRRTTTNNDNTVWDELRCELSKFCIVCLDGDPEISQPYPIWGEIYHRVPLGGFMQVNFAVNEALVAAVVEGALTRHIRRCADLYCGSGNFLLPLLSAGIKGTGVELNPNSITAARRAANEQNLGGDWICDDVHSWIAAQVHSSTDEFDLVVLDPPRAGLKETVPWVRQLSPRYLAICSCNPATLGRDLHRLVELGFHLDSIQLFDMFEHTPHVEVLAWLSLSGAP